MLPRDLVGNGSSVVGVDGSFAAVRAVRWAAAVAVMLEAPLHIVHARPSLGHNLSEAVADIRATEMEVERESATAILQSARHAAESDVGDVHVTTTEMDSPADEALTELSRTAPLIVLGCDEVSLGTAILIGSTTTVVAWRGDATTPTRQPIALGIDHHHDSRVAVTAAFEFVDRFDVGIIAVHAWSTRRPAGVVTLPSMIDWNKVESDARRHLSDRLAPWIDLYPDVEVTAVVDLDKPRRALLRHSQYAQMIVVGSRGRGLLAGALLGSTGLNLLHHAAIPVMICRSSDTGA
jgi:nucleotide-binding universal stress UspA family protein